MDRSEFAKLRNYVFGSTAAIVTNTSLVVGLGSAHAGKGAILGALLTIALADNISDSLGVHMYREAEGGGVKLSFLAASLNFVSRFLVSLSFVAIVMTFSIPHAVTLAIVWGLVLLVLLSYLIARSRHGNYVLETVKHVAVAVIAIALSRYVGYLIGIHLQ